MGLRTKILKSTINSRVYKYNRQDRIYYYETNRWLYRRHLKSWKYWRKTKYKMRALLTIALLSSGVAMGQGTFKKISMSCDTNYVAPKGRASWVGLLRFGYESSIDSSYDTVIGKKYVNDGETEPGWYHVIFTDRGEEPPSNAEVITAFLNGDSTIRGWTIKFIEQELASGDVGWGKWDVITTFQNPKFYFDCYSCVLRASHGSGYYGLTITEYSPCGTSPFIEKLRK